ncbi:MULTISPECIES: nuclear transport factor 2 family protein [Streptomyces]|uniref:Nuclear transport factor 2 family protein n=1 Tax=Streptomyces poriferorum TaxID=2798799 RepID=A0ABY9J170_9ACTN|nr:MULTISPECIES: nuclear transport factor 2 family protein [Streptomyces]MBW5252069.1 nuclear transport factor 2 family protein [Streptomyces poriferorum]MBW5258583.1 nuclear transport factor 2 family protein [Streptomyces poriferorum]MDP5309472.1 nuclear transport factor 2 family protein [Streptomyces sp. Alt4]WLQ61335.1 nuclear transport factor 2 family protein [Streptomyces sp. Alt2]WSI60846.1 nuclear transport factor 2 family protein [Streptomyces sp. NBC_01336]
MSAPTTPQEIFGRLIGLISAGKWSELTELYAEDAEVEIAFSPVPPRRIHGRAELRKHFAALEAAGAIRLRAENIHVHKTDDPEVVIAEFDYEGMHPATGRTFRTANIQVLRIRDGLIVETRDFHDHLAFAAADGRASQLLAALDQQG